LGATAHPEPVCLSARGAGRASAANDRALAAGKTTADAANLPSGMRGDFEVYRGTRTSADALRFQSCVLPFFSTHLRATET